MEDIFSLITPVQDGVNSF